jgi:hypothetical protein
VHDSRHLRPTCRPQRLDRHLRLDRIRDRAAAVLLGLAGLAARRWLVALIAVFVNPAALLYMGLSTGALC